MTAKDEILELMKQIPDDLTVAETITRLQSVYAAKGDDEQPEKSKAAIPKQAQPDPASSPLDGQAIKDRIVTIIKSLSDDLTAAEAVCEAADDLRLFYLVEKDFEDIKEGRTPPFEQRDSNAEFYDAIPEAGAISGEEFDRMTIKEKMIHTIDLLPADLTLGQAVYEALERLLFMYKLDKSSEQILRGETYTVAEVRRMIQEWRG